jgi:lipopolysaccharide transport system ATP-binding protein
MSDVAIRIEDLGKGYQLVRRNGQQTLRRAITWPLRALLGRPSAFRKPDLFWALRHVSLEVRTGEVLGIIGRNGAGKSTLLKLLSRIMAPTEGRIEIHGRVGSLLEVGTGFHPDLTGRENVYLNGSFLGMSRAEVRAKFDQIVSFSEIGKFIDQPVKVYSSGMYTRLAFAVAAHLDPEVLLVDEVLAVGDVSFQRKCLGKMGEVAQSGRTIFFVSHNMNAVETLCSRAVFLEGGCIVAVGDAREMVSKYLGRAATESRRSGVGPTYVAPPTFGTLDDCRLLRAEVLGADGRPASFLRFREPWCVRMVWDQRRVINDLSFSIRMFNQTRRLLFAVNTLNHSHVRGDGVGVQELVCRMERNWLVPGVFHMDIGAWIRPHTQVHFVERCVEVRVEDAPYDPRFPFNIRGSPAIDMEAEWKQSPLPGGVTGDGAVTGAAGILQPSLNNGGPR